MSTILFVDDSRNIREFCRRELEREGYRVLLAGDGDEALEVLGREVPDLVISSVEASDILVAHSAVVESETHALRFEDGKTLKVRTRILISMERLEFKEDDGDGRAVVEVHSRGSVEFLDEGGAVLFNAGWQGRPDETRVVLNGDRVEGFEARMRYVGVGQGRFEGWGISGQIRGLMDGQDASGLEVFKIAGEGHISNGT